MGAWGIGNFDNDAAGDWTDELEEAQDTSFLVETLEAVTEAGDEYLDVDECCRALAAAEVVAALNNAAHPDLPPEVKKWVAAHRQEIPHTLVQMALRAIERVRTDPDKSELKDLWDETKRAEEWYGVVSDLEARLRGSI